MAIDLQVIGVPMDEETVLCDDRHYFCCINDKEDWTQYGALRDTVKDRKWIGCLPVVTDALTAARQIRVEPGMDCVMNAETVRQPP
jgi:hypothetical protein